MPLPEFVRECGVPTGIPAVHLARAVVIRKPHLDAGGAVAARFHVGHARHPSRGIQGQAGPLVTAAQ